MQEIPIKVQVSNEVILQACEYNSKTREPTKIICIITHPYSQWGGSMHNNVVVGVRNYLVKEGHSCVTFNFRGVGKSTGGMGNGTEEKNDVIAIYNHVQKHFPDKYIIIIGYSYGGLISLAAASEFNDIKAMCLISYPTGFVHHLPPNYEISFPLLFIHGENDDIIPILRVKKLLPKFQTKTYLKSIDTDHFYNGKEKLVGILIQKFLLNLQIG